jgi:hypothetical protein
LRHFRFSRLSFSSFDLVLNFTDVNLVSLALHNSPVILTKNFSITIPLQ